MPWIAVQDTSVCPAGKPWAVKKKNADGSPGPLVACHPSKDAAHKQMAALYAKEPMMQQNSRAVSDKPWSMFTQADYTPQQWRAACLIDTGQGGEDVKGRYKVPVREPGGALNRNAVHAAAGAHGIGAVQGVSGEIKRAAAKKLVGHYRNDLNEDPPPSLLRLAGMQASSREPGVEHFRSVPFEVVQHGDGLTLEGYAAVYDSPAMISDWGGDFEEVIAPGAFARALRDATPVLMFEHGRHPLIGTMPLGVITQAEEDSHGLHIQGRLSDNWLIQPVRDAVRDGAVNGMSFRFSVPKGGDTWMQRLGQPDRRTVTEAYPVPELGPVVFPAYEPTTASIRSLLEDREAVVRTYLDSVWTPEQVVALVATSDLTGRPGARSAGGGAHHDDQPGNGGTSPDPFPDLESTELHLRAQGVPL